MHGATKDEDIFTEAWKTTAEYSLQWWQMKCVTTDGGSNMCGAKRVVVVQQIYRVEWKCRLYKANGFTLHYSSESTMHKVFWWIMCSGASSLYNEFHLLKWTEILPILHICSSYWGRIMHLVLLNYSLMLVWDIFLCTSMCYEVPSYTSTKLFLNSTIKLLTLH
jgi:hypothetical protein